jgi:hypothetical protein
MSDTTDKMQELARTIAATLPPHSGFVVLAFDLKPGGRIDYVSNCDREGVADTLRSWLDHVDKQNFAKHLAGGEFEMDPRLFEMKLWAWVGEDELGSKEFGLKQAIVPAGCIPMAACKQSKIDDAAIKLQLHRQARQFRKTISLVRFKFERVEEQLS